MKGWIMLLAAIGCEVVATSALKASGGFSRLWPSVLVVAGYSISFVLLAYTLRYIPVGIAYAVWAGLGIVLITLVAWLLYGQKLDAWAWLGLALIVTGVAVLNLLSGVRVH